MLNITPDQLRALEKVYPGITRSIDHFESMQLPRCTHCGSPAHERLDDERNAAVRAKVLRTLRRLLPLLRQRPGL
jgi:hypothetical protein